MAVERASRALDLTPKQELVFKLFAQIASKQEPGKLGAKEVEAVMTIAEQAAARILAVK